MRPQNAVMCDLESSRNVIGHMRRVTCAASVFLALAGHAAADATVSPPDAPGPYCQSGELYAPDGMITRIGSRHFRLCSRPAGPHGERSVRVTLNPDAVRDLADPYVLVALRVGDKLGFAERLQNSMRGREPADIRVFGVSAYQAFIVGPARADGLSNLATYVPLQLRVGEDGVPDHFIVCLGESDFPKKGSASCSIVISYFDVVASLGFSDFGGDSPPLPYSRFPDFPAEITRVLERADVTGDLERWIGRLPIIE